MKNEPINILFTGDFCPINRIEDLAINQDYNTIFNDFLDVFNGNDLNVVDLECPLTVSNGKRPKTGPYQKAHPDTIKALSHAGIGLAAMANNHIMDYGSEGVKSTLDLCKNNSIDSIGIGTTIEEAAKPHTLSKKGKKIAILNLADNEFITTPDGAFTCNPIDLLTCFYNIKDARKNHDYVIAVIHAGNEFYELPSPRTKELYRCIIDMGADVIVSHHTHAFSGFEMYHSKPIFYGLGNFIYDWPGKNDTSWNRGFVVKLKISDIIDFEIIPLKQCNDKPGVFHLSKEENDRFDREIRRLNEVIQDDEKLELEFQKYCKTVYPMYDAFIEPYFGKVITALRKRGLFPKLMTRRKRLLLLNLSRCDSHRDVLLRLLKENE